MRTYTNIPRTKKFVNNKLSPKLLQEKNASKEYCDALVKLGYTKDEILKAMGVEEVYSNYNDAIDNLDVTKLKTAIKNVKDFVNKNKPKKVEEEEKEKDPKLPKGPKYMTEDDIQEAGSSMNWTTSVSGEHNLIDTKQELKNIVKVNLRNLEKSLIAQGYDSSKLTTATNAVLDYANKAIDAIEDIISGTAKVKGKTYNIDGGSFSFRQESRDLKTKLNFTDNAFLELLENTGSNNSYQLRINGGNLLEMVLEKYNKGLSPNENSDDTNSKTEMTEDDIQEAGSSMNWTTSVNGEHNLTDTKQELKNIVKENLKNLKNSLIAQGYDNSKLSTAINAVLDYANKAIDAIDDIISGTAKDKGKTYNIDGSSFSFRQESRDLKTKLNFTDNALLELLENTGSNNSYQLRINGGNLLEMVLEKYNEAA